VEDVVRDALRTLRSESLIYGLGQVGGRGIQILLLPILTRALLPQAYGLSELVLAYVQAAALVLVVGMDGALARYFYAEPDRASRLRMVSTSLAFRVVVAGTASGVLFLASGELAHLLLGDRVMRYYILVGAGTLPLTLLTLFCTDVLRVTFQPWKFIVLNLAQVLAIAGFTLHFVLQRDMGADGVLWGRLLGDGVSAIVGLMLIRRTVRPRFHAETLRRMLAYGAPLVPGALAYGLITSMDRFFLQRYRTLEEVGIYAVAMKFYALINIVIAGFQLAYGPFAYARAQAGDPSRLFARVFLLYVAAASTLALAVCLVASPVVRILVPPSYWSATVPIAWLSFAAVAQGAYAIASIGVGLSSRTVHLAWTSCAAAGLAAMAHLVLTPGFGTYGAAASTWIGYGASAILTYATAQRLRPFPYRGFEMAALYGVALGLGLLGQFLPEVGVWGWVSRGLVLAVFGAWAYARWRSFPPESADDGGETVKGGG
jgi:O-antigen/teichoic acid export membrane protein